MKTIKKLKKQYPWADKDQLEEIQLGLKSKIDVSVYARPEFDSDQMFIIRLGLENGINVSKYANPYYSWQEM